MLPLICSSSLMNSCGYVLTPLSLREYFFCVAQQCEQVYVL